ncbi:MAG TPA: GNAT family N-acetyltransferase [Micromonosporaceae bacterium]
MTEVRRADEADAKAVVETLHRAFFDDPFSCYIFPDPDERERLHPLLMRSFVELALATGEIYTLADYACVAVWFPVTGDADEVAGDGADFVERTAALCEANGERFRTLAATLEHHHPAHQPHHHLQFLATVPGQQSQGLGRVLLRDRFRQLDAAGIPAYLESSSPRSAELYQREGFSRMTAFTLPAGPAAIPMWRPPVR